MPTRMQLRGFLVCLLLLLAFGENCAVAEAQVDYGTVTAIETYRAADNQPINAGTVLGGIAGGVIGHQIGSGGGKTAVRPSSARSAGPRSATRSRRTRYRARATVSP